MIWKHADDSETPVIVHIGQPLPRISVDTNTSDWYCPFQVVGLGDETIRAVFGVDAVQALYLALSTIGRIVAASTAGQSGALDWRKVPNFGFPK